ncbi:hypothetical protein GCM10009836_42930 [Pseudonocardia ailaonensis]|uniref:DUF4913 domain-containing protein n=1 Tax=Pseudonocardia ailaonensis TaxID=367279 RepID=A0ABN2N9K4_9PSEU
MSGADPTVVGLARSLERTLRRVGELEELVRRLATDVATLARANPPAGAPVGEAGDGGRHPGGWLGVADHEVSAAGIADLIEWVEGVYLRFPDAELPSCWLWHPAVVEELWWLRGAHGAAFDDSAGSWQRIGDWHDRFRPGVVKRLRAAVGDCELALHRAGTDLHDGPIAPLADAASEIARSWTTSRALPDPTEPQLNDAEQYDRAQHRRSHR